MLLLLLLLLLLLQDAAVMIFLVTSQRPRVAVALSATVHLASKRLCTSVSEEVAVEVVLPLKCFAADAAVVAALLAVGQSVLGESARIGEDLATDGARLRSRLAQAAGA